MKWSRFGIMVKIHKFNSTVRGFPRGWLYRGTRNSNIHFVLLYPGRGRPGNLIQIARPRPDVMYLSIYIDLAATAQHESSDNTKRALT